jgi:hypothetical protein
MTKAQLRAWLNPRRYQVLTLERATYNPNLVLVKPRYRYFRLKAALRCAAELAFSGEYAQVYWRTGRRRGQAVHIARQGDVCPPQASAA